MLILAYFWEGESEHEKEIDFDQNSITRLRVGVFFGFEAATMSRLRRSRQRRSRDIVVENKSQTKPQRLRATHSAPHSFVGP